MLTIHAGKLIHEEYNTYNLKNNSTIHINLRIKGGQKHLSIKYQNLHGFGTTKKIVQKKLNYIESQLENIDIYCTSETWYSYYETYSKLLLGEMRERELSPHRDFMFK